MKFNRPTTKRPTTYQPTKADFIHEGAPKDLEEDNSNILAAFMQSKVNDQSNESNLTRLRNKVFSLETLLKFGTFKFNFQVKNGVGVQISYLHKFFKDNEVSIYDFECNVKSIYNFSKMHGQRLAIVEGVFFFMNKIPADALKSESIIVYTPIWQREKAKEILKREMLANRPIRTITSSRGRKSGYSKELATKEQFVRSDVYDHFDRIFDRMVNDKAWYENNGRRYKETFLLHGEPGTGKTSLFMHFGAKHDLNVYSVTPASFVNEINELLSLAKQDDRFPLLVLIEDIDSCEELILKEFKSKNFSDQPISESEFTYSTFINTLDGAIALENMIVCMSTNYKHKLIPSVYRAGRVDHQLDVTPLTSEEIAAHVNTEQSSYIASLPDSTFSIANIVDLRYCKTIEEIDELAKWIKD